MSTLQPTKRSSATKSVKRTVPAVAAPTLKKTAARSLVVGTGVRSYKVRIPLDLDTHHVRGSEPKVVVRGAHSGSAASTSFQDMSDVQKHTLVSAGLQTKDFVVVVKKFRHLEQAAVLKALGISSKTVGRNAHDKLNLQHSGAALALLEVIELARDVLGSQDEAEQWISRPAPALDGNKPIDLLTTPPGVAAVKDLLNRIDYGVYA